MTPAERGQVHTLRLEARVNFHDPLWNNLWFEQNGEGGYLNLAPNNAPSLRNGQLVRIEGRIIPAEGLSADRVRVTVLRDFVAPTPVPTRGRISEVRAFDRRVVVTEGYVDEQLLVDSQHLRLMLLLEDRRVICWVPPDPNRVLPDWLGRQVRVTAVYSGRIDPTGTENTVELWVGRQSDVEEIGRIETDPRFELPLTAVQALIDQPLGDTVRIRGRMRQRDIGTSFVLSDHTGAVLVHCLQRERIPVGTEVEVVGRTGFIGSRLVLQHAVFRAAVTADPVPPPANAILDQVERIRALPLAEAAAGRPVDVSGVVTWALPEENFFFLQDQGGGVRVQLARGMRPPPLQKEVRVEGLTTRGTIVPGVEAKRITDIGSRAHPGAYRISYAQAISGREDGQWVEMRGFLRCTTSEGDWHWIHVTTPDGEFTGHLQSPVSFVATPGSLIRVRGVCETTTDAKAGITGVRLRVPFLHDLLIEEDAPVELYDLPVHRVADLRQLGAAEELARVHVMGQVVHQVPGKSIVVQDGDTGLMLYSRESEQFVPGDLIEAVGILGREGARLVLRETVVRRHNVAAAPAPAELVEPSVPNFANDLRLMRVRGTLLEVARHADQMQFTMQAGSAIFEATLAQPAGAAQPGHFRPGMVLELTGLYRIDYDDFDRPHGFQMQLRTIDDLAVIENARFWTVPRALLMAGGLAGGFLLIVGWVAALRHRVRVQTGQIRDQVERQANLEAELERAQRFRSLGLLAGGLAHDFNNLLTGILGNVTLAMLDEKAMALVGECLRDIEASAKRARDLTQQLVTFAKGGDPMRDSVPVPELLQAAAGFALSGAKARAECQCSADLWPVHADRNQLGRALQNLLVHAREAMPQGGVVTIHAGNETIDAATGAIAAGRYVRISIVDQGPGVPADRIAGFFDPYSATKFGDDRFAMAIAYSIIKRHGGHLEVQSSLGVGTVFRLWVPASEIQPVAVLEPAVAGPLPLEIAGTRVLLMDDEQTIRRLAERLLTRLECEHRTVPDGATCVQVYREALAAGRRYQIVILDLTVPGGMGGRECMAELLKIDPEVRAIVSSGYSNDPVMADFRQHGFRAVVPKPYAVGVLAEAIRRVLGAPQ